MEGPPRSRKRRSPTPAEVESFVESINQGSVDSAARKLNLSRHTVDWHIDSLRHKLGLHNQALIALWLHAEGWIDFDVSQKKCRILSGRVEIAE